MSLSKITKIFALTSETNETGSMLTLKRLMKKASFQVIYTRFFIISIRYKIMFQFLQLYHDHSYRKMVLTLTIQKSFKYL